MTDTKPKLLFFQWDHAPNRHAARFLLLHMQQQVRCLQHSFEVVVINEDCDYAAMCDRHQPDLALFESGYRSHGSRRIAVTNTRAHPQIPKLGLHNADSWCDRRAGFLSDMDHWGIETFFSICLTMADYTPAIREQLFVWPNSVDPELFHNYEMPKSIPVLLTGQAYGLYPWRRQVFPILADHYPSLLTPQFGYESRSAARMLAGESYARTLSASQFAASCGTMGKELVRKHFEIPASMTCLVTEPSAAVAAAGFRDMENCVFATGRDALERLDHLFSHPDELERITRAGFELVHQRHTIAHRPQLRDWFELERRRRPDQKIAQPDPFGPLVVVEGSARGGMTARIDGGLDRALLQEGHKLLWAGSPDEAASRYRQCLHYVTYLPEARFGLALCALQRGDAGEAQHWLRQNLEVTLVDYGAADPDPVEWAYFLVTLLCQGQLAEAQQCADRYPQLWHDELERVGLVVAGLLATGPRDNLPGRQRASLHELPEISFRDWLERLRRLLTACGQVELASLITSSSSAPAFAGAISPSPHREPGVPSAARRPSSARLSLDRSLARIGLRPAVPPVGGFSYQRQLARSIDRQLLGGRGAALRRLAASCFKRRQAPALEETLEPRLAQLIERYDCRFVLELGKGDDGPAWISASASRCQIIRIAADAADSARRVESIQRDLDPKRFDAVIIRRPGCLDPSLLRALRDAPMVILQGVWETAPGTMIYRRLIESEGFAPVFEDVEACGGCTVVRRVVEEVSRERPEMEGSEKPLRPRPASLPSELVDIT